MTTNATTGSIPRATKRAGTSVFRTKLRLPELHIDGRPPAPYVNVKYEHGIYFGLRLRLWRVDWPRKVFVQGMGSKRAPTLVTSKRGALLLEAVILAPEGQVYHA